LTISFTTVICASNCPPATQLSLSIYLLGNNEISAVNT